MFRRFSFLFILFLGILLSGCVFSPISYLQKKTGERIAEKSITPTKGIVDVDWNEEKLTIKTKEGEEIIAGDERLPTNFPKDMPIYPGAKPSNSWSSAARGGKGVMAGLETDDPKSKVISFYQAELPKNGWVIDTTTNTEEGAMFIVRKNDRIGWVTITAEKNEKTTIGIIVGDKKEPEG